MLPTARALGIEAPLVCADGVPLACGDTGRVLEQEGLFLVSPPASTTIAAVPAADVAAYARAPGLPSVRLS